MGELELRANPGLVLRLLGMAHGMPVGFRMSAISRFFVDRPYHPEPLVGGPDLEERLVSRLDAFDCVTFVESCWALARSRESSDFEARLRSLRYRDGRVEWGERNHYMSQWLERGEAAGLLERVLPDRWTDLDDPRSLSVVAGLPAVPWIPRGLALAELDTLRGTARTGDLVCFVSTRPDLDVFHVGLLVQTVSLLLRHASQARGQVVDEPLEDFLGRNETPGLLVARANDRDVPAGGGR